MLSFNFLAIRTTKKILFDTRIQFLVEQEIPGVRRTGVLQDRFPIESLRRK